MASSTERTEDALPRPELNPLLNPLLADNMGRWAEVYFTNPPEKREEAVLDLLRELQARNAARNKQVEETQAALASQPAIPISQIESLRQDAETDLHRCPACGHDNPLSHQFCGMCGARMDSTIPERVRAEAAEEMYRPHDTGNEVNPAPTYSESHDEIREPVDQEVTSYEAVPYTESAHRDPYDLSLFQGLREKESTAPFEYEHSPSVRYRYYIGAILAVLIAGLGYMAWRGTQASQNAQGVPPAPPAATETTPAPANQNPAPSGSTTPQAAHPQSAPQTNTTAESTTPKPAPKPAETLHVPVTASAEPRTLPSPRQSTSPNASNVGQQSSQGNGSEDFAVAQRYLSGADGMGRDGSEAAKWLWKAISNHNGPAMVALADLYLRGDGVSKNCDQARVLLDSAAQRGVAGAGTRLRNLQAFGCQ